MDVFRREWKSACIVPLYKDQGHRLELANYSGINQQSEGQEVNMKELLTELKKENWR